jgi:type IV pilus assembly protein PilZ
MADSDDDTPATKDAEPAAQSKRKVLAITIKDRPVLYAAYMSFLRHGGLFIPTKKYFAMGEEINLIVTLIDADLKYTVTGKVVWITPQDSQSNKAGGIGLEFADNHEGESIRKRIEEILGIMLQGKDATHTM